MSKDLKDDWKETGKELSKAINVLGKTLYKTGKKALETIDDWAENKKNNNDENE